MMLSKSQNSPTHIFTVMKYAYINMVNMYQFLNFVTYLWLGL